MKKDRDIRKSLAVDVETYEKLVEICKNQYRNKIDQLKYLIEKEYQRLNTPENLGGITSIKNQFKTEKSDGE